MHTILFTIGSLSFYTHGVFAVIGIILSAVLLYFLAQSRNLDSSYVFDNVIYSVLAGIIGARLTFSILYYNQLPSFVHIFYFWEGGLVSYGGFVFGGIAFLLLLKKQGQNILNWFDLLGISFPLGLFMGRLGEYVSGENFGVGTTVLGAVNKQVPINLYEAFLCLAISIILFIIYTKLKNRIKVGFIFALSILFYSAGRFVIDFWRVEKDLLSILSLGQVVSLLLFVIALVTLFSQYRPKRREVL
mgnify:FL=1